ncbi:MAG: protein jag [Limnochordia bacterium]|nr:protein jag [Limnochordia bacterium]MDD4517877.1 protein jag [Limnochordia bacterium]
MKATVRSGKTVDEAVRSVLDEWQVSKDMVEIEVLDEGNKGILGLFGKEAVVRVTMRNPMEEKGEFARDFLQNIVTKMGCPATVDLALSEDCVHLTITGEGLGMVIGRRGQTLDALQCLVSAGANKGQGEWVKILLDAEGYRARREETLKNLAQRLGRKVRATKRKAVLEPMSSYERRVIHLALQDEKDVDTFSEGKEPYRRVVIVPKS